MTSSSEIVSILERIEHEQIAFVAFCFTDMMGKWHRLCYASEAVTASLLAEGIPFDGSSLVGWRGVEESDMLLRPDLSSLSSIFVDPFTAHPTLVVICDVLDVSANGEPYGLDPRIIARRAQDYIRTSKVADLAYIGAELEFFVFDDVQCHTEPYHMGFSVRLEEERQASSLRPPAGDMGHYIARNRGYMVHYPQDTSYDMRSEMLAMCRALKLPVIMHLHEVAAGQHEMGFMHHELLVTADRVQQYKYVVHSVARSYGKTATFMPKPIAGCNGSGMHVHQSLWKDGAPLFSGSHYANLSEMARYYIGGVMAHARALNALTNPTTNSYKRLIPGFEAPVYLAYAQNNRSASIRVPFAATAQARRLEARFPDPAANPYVAFAALVMAGLDGIRHKMDPGEAMDCNIYKLSPEQKKSVPHLATSLHEALDTLEEDHAFLLHGEVFPPAYIERFIALKRDEAEMVKHLPHPAEYALYYSA